jgi:hypothetical protein
MHIDISKYEASKHVVINWYEHKGGKDIKRTISMMAQATFVPCIVIAYWLGAHTNWHPDCIAAIKRLTDFYGYTSITGKPDGSPI